MVFQIARMGQISDKLYVAVVTDRDQLVAVPKRMLDPRRPDVPSKRDKEEFLVPYQPMLFLDPKWTISHTYDVSAIVEKKIVKRLLTYVWMSQTGHRYQQGYHHPLSPRIHLAYHHHRPRPVWFTSNTFGDVRYPQRLFQQDPIDVDHPRSGDRDHGRQTGCHEKGLESTMVLMSPWCRHRSDGLDCLFAL